MVDFGPDRQILEGSHRAIASEAHPTPEAAPGQRPVTRRNFIVWYLAGLLTATVVALVAPILPYLYPPASGNKKQTLTIDLSQSVDSLDGNSALKFVSPSNTGFVMANGGGDNAPGKIAFGGFVAKDDSGKLNVFAINCSHLGCSVAWSSTDLRFECPCHGSQFSVDGTVVHGPAAYPLSNLTWEQGSTASQIKVQGVSLPGIG